MHLTSRLKTVLTWALPLASIAVAIALLELGFRAAGWFHEETLADRQRAFIDTYAIPYSFGAPRANVSLDPREYFPTGENVDAPAWVETNSHGLRMREIPAEKPPGVFRIACLGDSCTFGWMVPEETCYPRMLETLLREEGRNVEVLNFGVPGYTSFHGKRQFENQVLRFGPDIAALAFGFNDWYETRIPAAEFFALCEANGLVRGLRGLPLWLYDHSAFGRWLTGRVYGPRSRAIEAETRRRIEAGEWHPRVSKADYLENIRSIAALARERGVRPVLVNLDLPNSWVREPLRQLSAELELPLFDFHAYFRKHGEAAMPPTPPGLMPPGASPGGGGSGPKTLVFRVKASAGATGERPPYIVGGHEALGAWTPNTLAARDDGTNGDERAGDGVWTFEAQIEGGGGLDFAFMNDGPRGKWLGEDEAVDNAFKAIRHYHFVDLDTIPPGGTWVSPVYEFGTIPYGDWMVPGDPIHPDTEGHRAIAEAMRPAFAEWVGQ